MGSECNVEHLAVSIRPRVVIDPWHARQVGRFLDAELRDRPDSAARYLVFPLRFQRGYRWPASAIDFAAVERDPHVGGALVTLDHLDPGTDKINQAIGHLAGRRGDAGGAEQRVALEQMIEVGNTGLLRHRAGADALVHIADPSEPDGI